MLDMARSSGRRNYRAAHDLSWGLDGQGRVEMRCH
jgi:hypothetical protein